MVLLNTVALDPHRWTADKIPFFDLPDLLNPIRSVGFTDLEIWQYHLDHLRVSVGELGRMLDNRGMATRIVGIYPKLHLDGAEREKELSHMMGLVDIAAELGAAVIKMFVGSVGSAQVSDADYDRSVGFLNALLARAEQHDLLIAGETHENTLFDTPDSLEATLRVLNNPCMKVCFQPYDWKKTRQAVEDFDRLFEHIVHLHFQGRRDGRMVLLENADLDYERFVRHVVRRRFDGFSSIEFVKDCVVDRPEDMDLDLVLENARRDRLFLSALLNEGSAD
jgi:sugar phosphate isomerase/epimerase